MDLPSLTNALKFFSQSFDLGRQALAGQVGALFNTFVIFEVVLAGLYLALGSGAELKPIAKKILVIGLISWVIRDYTSILRAVVDGFLMVGRTAGSGTGVDFASLQDPDKVFLEGLRICKPAVDKLFADWNASYLGIPSVDAILLVICIVIAVLSYGLMAIQIFVTYLEFLLVSTAGFIFLPFGVFKPTAFLTERLFGAIIAFGVRLMVLALVIGVSDKFLVTIALPAEVTWQQAFEFVIISMALAFLSFHAPSVAASLLSGNPHLSAATVANTAASAAVVSGRSAEAASVPIAGTSRALLAGAGAAYAGAATRTATLGSGSSQGSSSLPRRAASKSALATLGAAEGVVTGITSAGAERLAYGRQGSPERERAFQRVDENGNPPARQGALGSFNHGRFSVPQYRKHLKREDDKRATSAGKRLGEESPGKPQAPSNGNKEP